MKFQIEYQKNLTKSDFEVIAEIARNLYMYNSEHIEDALKSVKIALRTVNQCSLIQHEAGRGLNHIWVSRTFDDARIAIITK